ncbi:hypothetical protein OLP40_04965 [Campylobacter jejuni]|nr:hypothetical protein C414_000420010 [Campylobacter jejuni subsp. jejuni 414]MCW1333623.1 hypothetical protein [Campylobacter jejuni]MCW1359531.1 hypothetical protein [Campylobacter jejuni]HDZ4932664.1 hypothetical protein [Campylobacter jejuni]HDZ4937417.1 hypothetical protein [Campylobacter jejuni]
MQVNYRMISSYEYDAISGQYKQVGKQVEDYSSSGDSDFMDMLNKVDEKSSKDALNSTSSFQSNTQNSNLSNYAQMSNIYAYRFRQDESELSMRAKSASVHNDLTQQGVNEQNKNNTLLNDLLNAI